MIFVYSKKFTRLKFRSTLDQYFKFRWASNRRLYVLAVFDSEFKGQGLFEWTL